MAEERAREGEQGDGEEKAEVPSCQTLAVPGDEPEHTVVVQPELADHVEGHHVTDQGIAGMADRTGQRQCRVGLRPGRQ